MKVNDETLGSHKPIAPWDWRKMSKVERDEFR